VHQVCEQRTKYTDRNDVSIIARRGGVCRSHPGAMLS